MYKLHPQFSNMILEKKKKKLEKVTIIGPLFTDEMLCCVFAATLIS